MAATELRKSDALVLLHNCWNEATATEGKFIAHRAFDYVYWSSAGYTLSQNGPYWEWTSDPRCKSLQEQQ